MTYSKNFVKNIGMLSIFCGLLFTMLTGIYSTYSTTSYAFSYQEYGLGSRMLLGSVYKALCDIFPAVYGPKGCFWFFLILALISAICFTAFGTYLSRKVKNRNFDYFLAISVFLTNVSFLAGENLGKTDSFLFIINILQLILLFKSKGEWLIPILSILGVLTHEGYLCMTAAISICLLLYKAINCREKRGYYIALFIANLIAIVVPAVYFVFLKTPGTQEMWNEAYKKAAYLHENGWVLESLVDQRVNFVGSTIVNDTLLKTKEIKQLPIFLICFIPILYPFLKMVISNVRDKKTRGTVIYCTLITFVLILIEFIAFCDFGRYFVWLVFCYSLIFGYIAINNQRFKENLIKAYDLSRINKIAIVLFMLLSTPLMSSSYSLAITMISSLVFGG